MSNLQKSKESIPGVLLWLDLILLIVGFFYFNKTIYNLGLILNIIFIGSYMIINKFGAFFEVILASRKLGKFANKLNQQLE